MPPAVRFPEPIRSMLPVLLAACALVIGCANEVDPFQESDLHFSIFGYLDAAADTQFVRVGPLRESLHTGPEPLDAVVTSEHLASGRRVVWRDSLFAFHGGRFAHNFWTPEAVLPGETYRFTATHSDGAVSTAVVTLPPPLPDPVLVTGLVSGSSAPPVQGIVLRGVAQLAQLEIVYDLLSPEAQGVRISYLERVYRGADGLLLGFDAYKDLRADLETRGCPRVTHVELRVAAAGPGWPDFASFDGETLVLAGTVSNVTNGLGFLGGVYKRRIPWPEVLPALEAHRRACLASPLR